MIFLGLSRIVTQKAIATPVCTTESNAYACTPEDLGFGQ
jgi:hypothetical protein